MMVGTLRQLTHILTGSRCGNDHGQRYKVNPSKPWPRALQCYCICLYFSVARISAHQTRKIIVTCVRSQLSESRIHVGFAWVEVMAARSRKRPKLLLLITPMPLCRHVKYEAREAQFAIRCEILGLRVAYHVLKHSKYSRRQGSITDTHALLPLIIRVSVLGSSRYRPTGQASQPQALACICF